MFYICITYLIYATYTLPQDWRFPRRWGPFGMFFNSNKVSCDAACRYDLRLWIAEQHLNIPDRPSRLPDDPIVQCGLVSRIEHPWPEGVPAPLNQAPLYEAARYGCVDTRPPDRFSMPIANTPALWAAERMNIRHAQIHPIPRGEVEAHFFHWYQCQPGWKQNFTDASFYLGRLPTLAGPGVQPWSPRTYSKCVVDHDSTVEKRRTIVKLDGYDCVDSSRTASKPISGSNTKVDFRTTRGSTSRGRPVRTTAAVFSIIGTNNRWEFAAAHDWLIEYAEPDAVYRACVDEVEDPADRGLDIALEINVITSLA